MMSRSKQNANKKMGSNEVSKKNTCVESFHLQRFTAVDIARLFYIATPILATCLLGKCGIAGYVSELRVAIYAFDMF